MNQTNNQGLQPLLLLLEKAEQILSIINLPDNVITKYNQLKELTFAKLTMDYTPLIKRNCKGSNSSYSKSSSSDGLIQCEILNRFRVNSLKKNCIIDYLFDFYDKLKYDSNDYMRQQLINKEFSDLLKNLDKINRYTVNCVTNLDDAEFELKLEDIKFKEILSKADLCLKNSMIDLKYSSNQCGPVSNHNYQEVIENYERKLDQIKSDYENQIKQYRDHFAEIKSKYNPQVEEELFRLRSEYEDRLCLLDQINDMITPVYDRYYNKNSSWYENATKIEYKFFELDRLNFIICLVDKFFSDNKYLIDLVSSLQNEKKSHIDGLHLPYVTNAIQNNEILQEIKEDTKHVERTSLEFHEAFRDIIDYINSNLTNF